MQSLSRKQLLLIGGAVLGLLIFVGLFFVSFREGKNVERVSLLVWGTESNSIMEGLARSYSAIRGNVTIVYKQIPEENFENELIKALAAGEGPDVFFVRSHSLPKNLLYPAPETQFLFEDLRTLFPRVIEQDFAPQGIIYAMPLYLDTLALIFNQNIFEKAGIVDPPKTWDDFEDLASDLKVLDDAGNIKKAGAAMGGTKKSIGAGPDILQMLMLQNGTNMKSDSLGRTNFASGDSGVLAFDLYTKFADPSSDYYTWDDSGKNSLDSFAAEEVAMIIDYKSKVELLKSKNPFIDIGISPVPQIDSENPAVFAEYFGLGVSRQSNEPLWAWDFVINVSTNENLAKEYSQLSKKPPALKSLISANLKNSEFGLFARQALIARSWISVGYDEVSEAFSQAIQRRISGAATSKSALETAQNRISDIIKANP